MNTKILTQTGLILLMCCFFTCSDTDTPQETETTTTVSAEQDPSRVADKEKYKKNTVYGGKARVTIEQGATYSDPFIKELSESGFAKEFLLRADGTMLIDQEDEVQLPKFLVIKDWYRFRAKKGDFQYSLEVQRQDHTKIVFRYVVFEKGDRLINVSKVVELGAHFFLGDESDEDDQTKESYLATEYSGNDGSCDYALRIGGEVGALKAKLIRSCTNEAESISLEEAPTLRQTAR